MRDADNKLSLSNLPINYFESAMESVLKNIPKYDDVSNTAKLKKEIKKKFNECNNEVNKTKSV